MISLPSVASRVLRIRAREAQLHAYEQQTKLSTRLLKRMGLKPAKKKVVNPNSYEHIHAQLKEQAQRSTATAEQVVKARKELEEIMAPVDRKKARQQILASTYALPWGLVGPSAYTVPGPLQRGLVRLRSRWVTSRTRQWSWSRWSARA